MEFKGQWDSTLPTELTRFQSWVEDVPQLNECLINREIKVVDNTEVHIIMYLIKVVSYKLLRLR